MKIIEITEDKISSLSEHIEKALRHAGKAMQCVEDMYDDGYGYGERDDDDWDDDDERMGHRRYDRRRGGMGERRRRDARGRYM